MSNEFIRLLDCPICGKRFVPAAQHIYKVDSQCVCSWGCQRKIEKKREAKREAQKRKRKASTMYKECETCVYYDIGKDDQPCCNCVEASNYEKGRD